MIDLKIDEKKLENSVKRAREKNIIIPTFRQQKNTDDISEQIKTGLKKLKLWELERRWSGTRSLI